MTMEEKRDAVMRRCDEYANCRDCPCGGDHFCISEDEWSDAPDYIIEEAYDLFFPSTPAIKDSGERREFPTGAVRDIQEGKGRMDLLPWAAILEVSKHCENGAKKYGEHNVDKGIPTHSLCDSAVRHLAKYLDGWTDEPHLLAAVWNLLWAVQMELKCPEMVDTPWRKDEIR